MATRPTEVKRVLDDLYWKTDEIRKSLISLHGMLMQSKFFDEELQPQQQYQQTVPPPAVKPVTPPPVVPPLVSLPKEKIMEDKKTQPQLVQPVVPPPVQKIVPPAPVMQPVMPPPPLPPRTVSAQKQSDDDNARSKQIERFIGERLVTFIGIAVLVTGIAFFVKYAIDKDWISETGRTAIGILCGGILLGFAHRLRKTFTVFSSVLAGGGIAVLYFAISYAFQVYGLFSQPVAFGLLVVVTGFTVALSVAYDRIELAVLAIIGGFATPLMVSTGQGNFTVLCTYMLILDLGMLALAYYKKWNLVNILSYAFTLLTFSAALFREVFKAEEPQYTAALVFASLFYLTFFFMNVVNNVRHRVKFNAGEIIGLLTNTGLYYAAGYFILHQMQLDVYHGLFTLLVAVFNFIFAFALFRRQEVDRLLVYFLIGLVITFVSLAGPVQLEGNHITLFWAAEAALLYWLWQRSSVPLIRVASVLINGAMFFSLLLNWMRVYMNHDLQAALPVLANKGFVTGIFVVLSLVVTSLLLKKEKEDAIISGWDTKSYRAAVNITAFILLYFTGLFELYYQLNAHAASGSALAVYSSGYTAMYCLAAWFAIKPLGIEYMRWTVGTVVTVMLMAYMYIPHTFTTNLRNHFLAGDEAEKTAFLFHYLGTAVLIALAWFIGRKLMKSETGYKEVSGFFLWLMCFFFVFVVSAELDHFVVINGFNRTAGMTENHALAIDAAKPLLEQDHRIGFPIAWGICSFIMIIIGMRKNIRQLRIIALVLFFVSVVKLIMLGFSSGSQAGKIIAFISCGVILLLVSFLYQKLKKMIFDDDSSTEKQTGDEKIV